MLITAASSRSAQLAVAALSNEHDLRLTDLPGNASGDVVSCELGHDEATDRLVAGIEAIVHIGYGGQQGDATTLIDYHTRCTYNLLMAASNAGVGRVIYISTLRLLEEYEENLTVTEKLRSLPPADNVVLLACHMGEYVCREFARDRLSEVVTLRLGWPIVDGGTSAAVDSGGSAALSTEDLARVLRTSLTAGIAQWQDVHVQSVVPNQRYLMHAAANLFGYPEPAAEGMAR